MSTATIAVSGYKSLPLANIHESTTNPRRTFDAAKLQELAESIASHGIIQPITVRPAAEGFELVFGARRYRAAKLAEQIEIPVIVRELSDAQALELQIIENAQRQDVHPYEEAAGYQRLLELPGRDVAGLAAKCGKSQSHIYSRLTLLQLITDIAEAFQQDKITAAHANLIARLPAEQQPDAYKACWRTEYNDKEGHLLPAKHLTAWIDTHVYLPLAEAPFSLEDATLNEETGPCTSCPQRTGFNSLLFAEVTGDMCLRAACYHGKVSAHVQHSVAARPELVQIATEWRREDDPAVIARNDYQSIERNKDEHGNPKPCPHTREAIIAFGDGAGTLTKVCIDTDCEVHAFRHVPTFSPEQLEVQKQRAKEEKARQKKMIERKVAFERIISKIPATLAHGELRFLLRALVYSSGYNIFEDVAVYFAELNNERTEQSDEEILDGVITRANAGELSAMLARIALTDHIDIPREEQVDFLTLAADLFLPKEEPKPTAKKAIAKSTAKPPAKKITPKKAAAKKTSR